METETAPKQESSMMHEPTYNQETQTLTIHFKKGGIYHYPGITSEQFAEFLAAASWGKHYHSHKAMFEGGIKQASQADAAIS